MYKNKKIIYIYGASGAGSTTLGEAIIKENNGVQFDTDYYFWKHYNEHQKRMDDMINDIKSCKSNFMVITGSFWNWKCDYSELIDYIDYYVRIVLNHNIRMERLLKREKERYGSRIDLGGDLYEVNKQRIEWANNYDNGGIEIRSLKSHMYYEEIYHIKPIIIDSANSVNENVKTIKKIWRGNE